MINLWYRLKAQHLHSFAVFWAALSALRRKESAQKLKMYQEILISHLLEITFELKLLQDNRLHAY